MNPEARTKPMEVLVLGLCRTGTLSVRIALEKLGYANAYHFSSVFEHEPHPEMWIAALEAEYEQPESKSELLDPEYWDRILGDYNAVTDIPSACFAAELIAAYPAAKIILTTRSAKSWHASMLRTIHALQVSYLNRFLLLFSGQHLQNLSKLMDLIIKHYFRGSILFYGKEVFEEHNEAVRRTTKGAGKQMLEFELGNGWEELCGFLGKPVPDIDFPHVNERETWRAAFNLGWTGRNIVLLIMTLIVAMIGIWIAS